MKTLRAFWHWVDNEKPSAELYAEKAGDNLSDLAHQALIEAERLVGVRAGAASVELLDRVSDEEHRFLRPAFRDLSLALCAALEHMHEQVEDDYLGKRYPARPHWTTQATVPPCAACNRSPCDGSHVSCSPARYLRENGLYSSGGDGGEMLKREYMGGWHRSFDLSSDAYEARTRLEAWLPPQPIPADGPLSGRRITAQEILNANHTFDAAAYHRIAMLPFRRVPGDMGDIGERVQLRGRTGSSWDPERRQLEVYTAIDRDGVDRLRGLQPRTIIVRGRAADYAPGVLPYLRDVIQAMAGTATTNFHEGDDALIYALGFR